MGAPNVMTQCIRTAQASQLETQARLDRNCLRKRKCLNHSSMIYRGVVTIRHDKKVSDAFKASGPGWQTWMNEALKKVVVRKQA